MNLYEKFFEKCIEKSSLRPYSEINKFKILCDLVDEELSKIREKLRIIKQQKEYIDNRPETKKFGLGEVRCNKCKSLIDLEKGECSNKDCN